MRGLLLLLLLLPLGATAAEPTPVTGTLTLRHVSTNVWQADYRFNEAVEAVDFGPAVVNFRREAWTLPESLPFGDAQLKPLRGGESVAWKLVGAPA